MSDEFLLLNPGPVPVAPDVRAAMAEPMVSHRSAEFEAVYERAQDGLEYVFERSTPDERPTAEVVSLVNGKFGRRFARIADRHARCTRVEADWGDSLDLDDVRAAVSADTDVVTMVHNETSTGLLNPVAEVGEVADAHDARFVVDGVTSIGGDEFRVDDWHVDVAVTDAQKALAAPPGVSALYATPDAAEAFDGDAAPFYEDLDWHLRKAESHQTPFTSAVPLFRALAAAVERIHEEGMDTRIARHRRQSAAFRAGFDALGLAQFPEVEGPTELSNTLTAIALPPAVRADPDAFFDAVAERNVSISGGQAHLGGEIFRVSNMGELADEQVLRGVRTVGEALADVGVDADPEAGVEAARAELDV